MAENAARCLDPTDLYYQVWCECVSLCVGTRASVPVEWQNVYLCVGVGVCVKVSQRVSVHVQANISNARLLLRVLSGVLGYVHRCSHAELPYFYMPF